VYLLRLGAYPHRKGINTVIPASLRLLTRLKMSLHALTQHWLPSPTHKSLSDLDAGLAVLVTSFVSYQFVTALACQLLTPDVVGVPFDFSLL
jgi:hypothetical protein